jgi:hypothetical protein
LQGKEFQEAAGRKLDAEAEKKNEMHESGAAKKPTTPISVSFQPARRMLRSSDPEAPSLGPRIARSARLRMTGVGSHQSFVRVRLEGF